MGIEVGQTVEGYKILERLDSSGFAATYKALHIELNRFECMKVLPEDLQGSRQAWKRFQREASVLSLLRRPNIVTFYRAFPIQGRLVITTEFLEGETLAERLRRGRLPWPEAVDICCQALAGLGCAHERGIVHRCVAPSNLVITPDGTVKLTEFGLAKAAGDPQLTLKGFVIGIADYISPEQVSSNQAVDGRSDIYSLGAVLYEAVVGRPPFPSKSAFEVMRAHVNEAPVPPRGIRPDLPSELDEIILRALAKRPSERFPSAEAFRQALLGVKQSLYEPA